MSTTLEAGGWIAKLAMAVATGTVIGGGTMVLNLHRNDAVQDEKFIHVEATVSKIDRLRCRRTAACGWCDRALPSL